ncbi:Clan CD, family C14, metacaspase-like cysteine peptidase [Histomonas meleagridis]|uniref:Clan CD, family C14, metacaspase-like cysteine peptidase n=1 Tax=Histomonas meleagridis TaxID=135588 RepID=UPI0035594A3F|nr:Clan CD, family C14, metacaspase-like cysteine peptidase [Histomonas meleagridis]KAH0806359.1 Clan CD, family C14, metacaspase-like cysteine peptidase [Histomonas meleagridis]
MGCNCSYIEMGYDDFDIMESLPDGFNEEDIENVRNRGNEYVNMSVLYSIGIECQTLATREFPHSMKKSCFLCINTINPISKEEKINSINDSIAIAQSFRKLGYNVYFVINPVSTVFFSCFRIFLSQTTNSVVLGFFGYTRDVISENKNSNLLFFNNELIPCSRINDFINAYKVPTSRLLCMFDCSHIKDTNDLPSKSIFISDNLPPNTTMISIEVNEGDPKSQSTEINSQGYLSFSLCRIFSTNTSITMDEIENSVNEEVQRFGFHVVRYG